MGSDVVATNTVGIALGVTLGMLVGPPLSLRPSTSLVGVTDGVTDGVTLGEVVSPRSSGSIVGLMEGVEVGVSLSSMGFAPPIEEEDEEDDDDEEELPLPLLFPLLDLLDLLLLLDFPLPFFLPCFPFTLLVPLQSSSSCLS